MLRRIRREGLTLSRPPRWLIPTSTMSTALEPPVRAGRRHGQAKIDAIEQQMAGVAPMSSRPVSLPPVPAAVSSRPAPARHPGADPVGRFRCHAADLRPSAPPAARPRRRWRGRAAARLAGPATAAAATVAPLAKPAPAPAPVRELPPLAFDLEPFAPEPAPAPAASAPAPAAAAPSAPAGPAPRAPAARLPAADLPEVEVLEIKHDPELDEAVIAFANADFTHSERVLVQMTGQGAPRQHHEDTWLVLFDLYRATGQQQRFEALSLPSPEQCGRCLRSGISLPQLLSDATAPRAAGGQRPRRLVACPGWTATAWRCSRRSCCSCPNRGC
jgi:hypothetical protein